MKRQTVISGPNPRVILRSILGDLRVTGWERGELSAKTNGDQLELIGNESGFVISCDDDLILNTPARTELNIESVSGDVDLRAFSGLCRVGQVGGDLAGRALGSLQAQTVGGNLSLRGASGDFSAASVGGDVSLRFAQAGIFLQNVGGDLYLRGASGNIQADLGGDAVLYIEPRPQTEVSVNAGGDILLRLPAEPDARLVLQSGCSGGIHINLPGIAPDEETATREITMGNGSTRIRLAAGGDLTVTSQADEWESAADFDFDMDFTDLPSDLSGHIQRQVERAAQQAERAVERAQRAERRIQAKVNARVGRWGMDWSGSMPRSPRPPAPPSEPVSDEERLTILRMLADRKITAQEAEKLLAALE